MKSSYDLKLPSGSNYSPNLVTPTTTDVGGRTEAVFVSRLLYYGGSLFRKSARAHILSNVVDGLYDNVEHFFKRLFCAFGNCHHTACYDHAHATYYIQKLLIS